MFPTAFDSTLFMTLIFTVAVVVLWLSPCCVFSCTNVPGFIYSTVEHLGSFNLGLLEIFFCVCEHSCVYLLLNIWTHFSQVYTKNGTASTFKLIRQCQIIFQSSCASFQSHKQWMRVPVTSYTCQYSVFSPFCLSHSGGCS